MPKIILTRQIAAPLGKVWESWDDFGNIYQFHPGLEHSRLTEDTKATRGVGCRRQCDMANGKDWIREEIVEYVPEKLIRLAVYDGTMPLEKAEATFYFETAGKKDTKVTLRMEFMPKFGVFGLLMIPMIKMMFKKRLGLLLDTNAKFVEQGNKLKET